MKDSKSERITKTIVLVTTLIFFHSCSLIPGPSQPKIFDRDAIENIKQAMDQQEKAVQTVVSSGNVSSGDWDGGAELGALIVGTRDPFRVKIEITHPWGRPLLHILVTESMIKILSFSEKKLYLAETRNGETLEILGIPMDTAIIWSFVRAFPALLPHSGTKATTGEQFTLTNDKKENIQTIDLYPKHAFPRSSFFVKADTELFFSDYDEKGTILYARKIIINKPRKETRLVFIFDRTTVNKPVPDEIFDMNIPAQFQTVPLEEERIAPIGNPANAK